MFYHFSIFKLRTSDNIKSYELGFQDEFFGIFIDSKENFYLGFNTGIYCYSPSGEYLFKLITPNSTESYAFVVSDDIVTVWLNRSDIKYVYSLSGKLISKNKYEYSEKPQYGSSLELRKAWKGDELIYRYHSIFGFWWVTNKSGQCLTRIPFFMYVLKISMLTAFVCLWILLYRFYTFCMKPVKTAKTGDGSLS